MKARLLLIAGRYKNALSAFRDAIASKPGDQGWKAKLSCLPIYHASFFIQELPNQADSDFNAAECYRLAAELGNPVAYYTLGLLYMTGQGVEQNFIHAFVWLVLAKKIGDSRSLSALSEVYQFLQKNENFQLDSRRPSALAQAKHDLGVAYYFGNGTEQDYMEAAKWFQEAAEMGLADSRYNLGLMYADGQGVPKNPARAYFWLHSAALQGDEKAAALRDSIVSDLSTAEMAEASALINDKR